MPRETSRSCNFFQGPKGTGSISDTCILHAEGHKNGSSSGRNCILSGNIEKNAGEPLKCLYNVQKSLPSVGKTEMM